jgi:Sulfotransferase domain
MNNFDNKELLVDFFLAGTAKSGSSSLAEYLAQHPQVCFAYPKEPVFFAEENFESKYATTWQEYKKCFKKSPEHKITGEGSILYMYSDTAVKNILEYNPKAKFIIMLRNPIDQAYSFFLQLKHSEYESEKEFADAWNRQPLEPKSILNYKAVVSSGSQLQKLLSQAAKDNVLILTLEELIEAPRAMYLKVLDFLDLEDDGKTEFEAVNQAGDHRNALLKFIFMFVTKNKFLYKLATNTIRTFGISTNAVIKFHKGKKIEKTPLSDEMRKSMALELKDDVQLISEILGRDMTEKWQDFNLSPTAGD